MRFLVAATLISRLCGCTTVSKVATEELQRLYFEQRHDCVSLDVRTEAECAVDLIPAAMTKTG